MTDQQTTPKAKSEDRVVRLAHAGDEEALMVLCRLLHQENGAFPMDEDRVREILHSAFQRQGGMIGVVDSEDGTSLDGCIVLTLQQMWYSNEWYLGELFLFVHPERRRGGPAARLIRFGKEMATKLGLPLVIGVLSNQRTEEKVRMYQRELGPPAGAFFMYGATTGAPGAQH